VYMIIGSVWCGVVWWWMGLAESQSWCVIAVRSSVRHGGARVMS
jgi:hypothetical protein